MQELWRNFVVVKKKKKYFYQEKKKAIQIKQYLKVLKNRYLPSEKDGKKSEDIVLLCTLMSLNIKSGAVESLDKLVTIKGQSLIGDKIVK